VVVTELHLPFASHVSCTIFELYHDVKFFASIGGVVRKSGRFRALAWLRKSPVFFKDRALDGSLEGGEGDFSVAVLETPSVQCLTWNFAGDER
jgi:hypothetical protein